MYWNVRFKGGIMSLEYEIQMQELKVMKEKQNRLEQKEIKKQIYQVKSQLKTMKYKHFEDPIMSQKIKIVNENIAILEKLLKQITSQDN